MSTNDRATDTAKSGKVIRVGRITRAMVQADRNAVFVFGDNMARKGLGGQAAEMRGEPNAIGVPTKWRPSRDEAAYFTDDDSGLFQVREAIDSAFQAMQDALRGGRNVVIPADGLGTGLADLPRRAPVIHRAIEARIRALS